MKPTGALAHRLAREVRAEMARKGMPVAALAEHMNVSRQTISRLLNSHQSIDIDQLERIGMILGIDPDSLLRRAVA